MATHLIRLRESRSWPLDVTLGLMGLIVLALSAPDLYHGGWDVWVSALVGVPVIAIVARFPIVLDGNGPGIEIGFDSAILMFLLCTLDPREAVAIWGLGVVCTQLIAGKRLKAVTFNIGVGILAGACAAATFYAARGDSIGTPRELGAMVLAAGVYYFLDYIVSAVSVGIDSATPILGHLVQPGSWLALACLVPFDLLGYLGAVVARTSPWWTSSLLAVPLITLLIATRAVTRGRENSRRLTVLLEAAVRVQSVHEPALVLEALRLDARRLIRLDGVDVRDDRPGEHEIGARVRRGKESSWVVAPARDRARSTVQADQRALDALAVLSTDALARLQLTADMVHYARHDPLTDLPNRGILLDRVTHALALARRREARVALLFIDLDEFKPVNDRFGHAAGDAVLVEVARRLTSETRANDTVARLGGDEFAVLLEDVTVGDVVAISDRILASLNRGHVVNDRHVSLGASIGIAYGDGSDTGEALLRQADLAMYEAKGRGKAQAVSYETHIGRASSERLELVEELRLAIEKRALHVIYQPVFTADAGRVVGVEALVRWRLDTAEVPTEVFIRIAEETGLVVPLGELVLELVTRDAAALRLAAGGPISVSVNISARQLLDRRFVAAVERAVAAMPGTDLVLEITERQGIGENPQIVRVMRTIAAMGVGFAIDDFGVGFSSMSYLRSLPVDVLKTDASLSQHVDKDDRDKAVLRAITVLGAALGMHVVIEGIERESQLEVIRHETGAPLVQGYLLQRPADLDTVLTLLRERCGAPAASPHREAWPRDLGPMLESTVRPHSRARP